MTNLERYMSYCQCLETTELYAEFSFYSLIAACLQRRCWLGDDAKWRVFPNLYLVFVGNPGTGKTIAASVNKHILSEIKLADKRNGTLKEAVHNAPDSITVEKLIQVMSLITDGFTDPDTKLLHTHSSVNFIAEELGNLFKKNDENLVRFLVQGYDCGNFKKETKNNGCESIGNMCINFLAATTYNWMSDAMSYSILNDGFLGRALFIAGGECKRRITFFKPTPEQQSHYNYIQNFCRELVQVCGHCTLSYEASKFFENWNQNEFAVLNPDKKLIHYYARKKINVMKLSTILHFSENLKSRVIEKVSIERAIAALARAEMEMHLAFASVGKNPVHNLSGNILNFLKNRKKPYPMSALKMIFHDEGTMEETQSAIQYLILSNKVKPSEQKLPTGEVMFEFFSET